MYCRILEAQKGKEATEAVSHDRSIGLPSANRDRSLHITLDQPTSLVFMLFLDHVTQNLGIDALVTGLETPIASSYGDSRPR